MKKILAFLASFTLIATSASSVVACGDTKTSSSNDNGHLQDSVKLDAETRRKFALKLQKDASKNLGIKEGDLWNKLDLDAWINNYIDGQLSELYTEDTVNKNLSERLKMQDVITNPLINNGKDFKRSENRSVQEVNELNSRMASLSFFTTYTSAMARNAWSALDFDAKYGPLNPSEVDGVTYKEHIGIYFKNDDGKYTRWTAVADASGIKNLPIDDVDLILGAYLPTQAQLGKTDGFALVKESETDKDLILDTLPTDKVIKDNLSGKEALTYRFQSYLKNEVESKNLDKILTMQFMKNEMYNFAQEPIANPSIAEKAANQALYYNNTSNFVKTVQGWNLTADRRQNYTTNLKMVWSISLDADKTEIIEKANTNLNTNQDVASQNNNIFSTYRDKLESLYGLANDKKSTNILEILQLLSDIAGDTKADTIDKTIAQVNALNHSEKGNDPIFGIKGFQGFTRNINETSVEAVIGGNLEISDAAKTKVAQVNGSGVVKNQIRSGESTSNAFDFTFDNPTSQRRRDIIIVLPIYLIDLWKQVNEPPKSGETTKSTISPIADETQAPNDVLNLATNTWVRLLPQVKEATWSGNTTPNHSANIASGWKKIEDKDVNDKTSYPTTKAYRVVNGQTYVFLPDTTEATFALNGQTNAVNIKFNQVAKTWEEEHNFAVSGIAQNTANAMITNGQNVNFNVHLGPDARLSDLEERRWSDYSAGVKRSDDLAYHLTAKQKSELVETLMYMITLKDTAISEHAKTRVYSYYINAADIYYKPLYDRVIKYIRTNNHPEESD